MLNFALFSKGFKLRAEDNAREDIVAARDFHIEE
jgi:hypothetical protein